MREQCLKWLATVSRFARRPGEFLPPPLRLTVPRSLLVLIFSAWAVAMAGFACMLYRDSQCYAQSVASPDAIRPVACDVKGQATRFITPAAARVGEVGTWLAVGGIVGAVTTIWFAIWLNRETIRSNRAKRKSNV